MIDPTAIESVLAALELDKKDRVIEVGAGTGILTKYIAKKAGFVYAIEKDEKFFFDLRRRSKQFMNLEIAIGDFLNLELPKFDKIVSNLPYSVADAILWRIAKRDFRVAVFTMPLSLATNISDGRSKLSLYILSRFKVQILSKVSPACFSPVPRTTSAIVVLRPKEQSSKDKFVQLLIEQKDKKMRNALREALVKSLNVTKREAREKLRAVNMSESLLEKNISNLSNKDLEKLLSLLYKYLF